jgi:hypothetical protein
MLIVMLASACSSTDGSVSTSAAPTTTSTTQEIETTVETGAGVTTSTSVEPDESSPDTTEPPSEDVLSAPLGPLTRYDDAGLGFSFVYPAGWKLTESAAVGHNIGGAPLKTVGAFDPTGNRKDEILLEGVSVSVFNLGVGVTDEHLPTFRAEVEDKVSLLQAGLSKVIILEPLRETTVGYEPGFETTFTFDHQGRRLRTRLVFVVSGDLEYQLVSQAADASYDTSRPQLDMVVDSFRPGE